MSEIIKLLPEFVANQIAAGEVVQRPASALKELIENALDAQASSIQVLIKEGGKTLIQVIDNGKGMSPADARMSFRRHATSKIERAEDLFQIRSMGFRGEALPSIAAVAQVVLKTRKADQETGTEICIEGAELISEDQVACPPGTSVAVKNLFFNIPARRNFLKSNPVEFRHIIDEFQRQSLAHSHVFFSLNQDGNEVFHLPKSNLKQRIVHLFGNSYAEKILAVEESTEVMKLSGFIGKPDFAKKTRGEQFFFINNRYIREPYFHHAVMNAYQELLPAESIPFYTLFIEIDPSKIDINVHPSKTEIKFENEKVLYAILRAAIKRSLGQHILTPSIDFNGEAGFAEIGILKRNDPVKIPSIQINPDFNPFKKDNEPRFSSPDAKKGMPGDWMELYKIANAEPGDGQTLTFIQEPASLREEPEKRPFQINQRFIITSIKSGLLIIDQQAAHERVLYEQYMNAMEEHTSPSQQTLFPQTLSLSPSDSHTLEELLPEIKMLGFDIRSFGKNTYVIEGIPSDLNPGNEHEVIETLLESYKENLSFLKLEKRDNLARSLARKAAIKSGRKLDLTEMVLLIDQLFACQTPSVSPAGKPVFINMGMEEIIKKFEK